MLPVVLVAVALASQRHASVLFVSAFSSQPTDHSTAPGLIFIAPFQPGGGTRQGRSAPPAMPPHSPPIVLRSACGSHRRPGLRAIAPGLALCRDDVLRRQAQAAAPVARSQALRDVRRRSPAA